MTRATGDVGREEDSQEEMREKEMILREARFTSGYWPYYLESVRTYKKLGEDN